MTLILQYNASDKNHLTKEITDVTTLTGTLRTECSVENPIIILEGDITLLNGVNYFSITELNRSYFLTGQKVIRNDLIEIHGHVDVLASFADAIREQTAIVKRQATEQGYNLYLNDGSLKTYQDPYILTKSFPSGFTGTCFILTVAGS